MTWAMGHQMRFHFWTSAMSMAVAAAEVCPGSSWYVYRERTTRLSSGKLLWVCERVTAHRGRAS